MGIDFFCCCWDSQDFWETETDVWKRAKRGRGRSRTPRLNVNASFDDRSITSRGSSLYSLSFRSETNESCHSRLPSESKSFQSGVDLNDENHVFTKPKKNGKCQPNVTTNGSDLATHPENAERKPLKEPWIDALCESDEEPDMQPKNSVNTSQRRRLGLGFRRK